MALRICIAFAIPLSVLIYKYMPVLSGKEGNLLIFLCVIAFVFCILSLYLLTSLVLYAFVLIGRFLSCMIDSFSSTTTKSFKRISSFTDFQKVSFSASIVSVVLLGISLWAIEEHETLGNGYYVFLRIVMFGAMVCLCFEKLSIWWKVILILNAILFNPVIQIHLDDIDAWMCFDVIAILLIFISWIVLFRKAKVEEKNIEIKREETKKEPPRDIWVNKGKYRFNLSLEDNENTKDTR